MINNAGHFLEPLIVTEIGDRIAAGVCGSLLAQAGATVILVEPLTSHTNGKWRNRPVAAAGKSSVIADNKRDREFIDRLLARSDVVIASTDISPLAYSRHDHQIVCDITAFGGSGPLAGKPNSDALIQALSGIADTTGDPAHAPTLVGFPVIESSAGIYAAAAALAALRVRRRLGFGQDIEIALYDCAINALPTFLPFHMVGKLAGRLGNRHPLVSPWNAYRTRNDWILICAATNEQWSRLCNVIERPELAETPKFKTNADRVSNCDEVDAAVQQWTATQSIEECIARLGAIGIVCGPITTIAQLAGDDNLVHRNMLLRLADPVSEDTVTIAGTPLKASRSPGLAPAAIPTPNRHRVEVEALLEKVTSKAKSGFRGNIRPCTGLRVVEIGQYTTAPLVSRQLAALGAEVLKIEPPEGDSSRNWPPSQGDLGYFFMLSNADKRSVMLDLRNEHDKQAFRKLLQSADVLVENLKPGSLARLGFSPQHLTAINPRLVYCGISGFGADSKYPGRPAFDVVVQAMSGFMDLTRAGGGTPIKVGISAADIIAGEFGLFSILAALEYRDRTGGGQAIDLSMQDTAVWVTQTAWNGRRASDTNVILKCRDGYVILESDQAALAARLAELDSRFRLGLATAENYQRAELVALAARGGITGAPVLNISEVITSAQTVARNLIGYARDKDGRTWMILNSPLFLKATPPAVTRLIGALGEANAEILGGEIPAGRAAASTI
ncbi:MAG: CoA transferase [Betaproteobacteria bacterium]|nr:CoA transferase [Betaproteobacteria bacterium]